MKRPAMLWILIFWLAFLACGGLYGGIAMLLDPSGKQLQMNEVLSLLPVSNFLLPGLFLLLIMGAFPLLVVYGLLALPKWSWVESILSKTRYHWAWVGAIVLTVVLVVWLIIEGILIGFKWPIQYITAINGLLILLFTSLPSVRKYYKKN
jgi:hypothetical protein